MINLNLPNSLKRTNECDYKSIVWGFIFICVSSLSLFPLFIHPMSTNDSGVLFYLFLRFIQYTRVHQYDCQVFLSLWPLPVICRQSSNPQPPSTHELKNTRRVTGILFAPVRTKKKENRTEEKKETCHCVRERPIFWSFFFGRWKTQKKKTKEKGMSERTMWRAVESGQLPTVRCQSSIRGSAISFGFPPLFHSYTYPYLFVIATENKLTLLVKMYTLVPKLFYSRCLILSAISHNNYFTLRVGDNEYLITNYGW